MHLLTKFEISTRSDAIYLAHRNHLVTASVAARTVAKFNLNGKKNCSSENEFN